MAMDKKVVYISCVKVEFSPGGKITILAKRQVGAVSL